MRIGRCVVLEIVDVPVEKLGFSSDPQWEAAIYLLSSGSTFDYWD